jgi:hypothetical protein
MRPASASNSSQVPSVTVPERLAIRYANRDLRRERPMHRARLCGSQFNDLDGSGAAATAQRAVPAARGCWSRFLRASAAFCAWVPYRR